MIVGVYGVGYAAAALDPLRHWPVVLVGLLGKIFGPTGLLSAVLGGTLPLSFGLTILTDDLVAPFRPDTPPGLPEQQDAERGKRVKSCDAPALKLPAIPARTRKRGRARG
jgi:hypothetical protein